MLELLPSRRFAILLALGLIPLGAAWAVAAWVFAHPDTTAYERPFDGCQFPVGRTRGFWVAAFKVRREAPFTGLDGFVRYKDTKGQMHRGTLDDIMPIASQDRGFWGLKCDTCPQGAVVLLVVRGLPAAEAGLSAGDIIIACDSLPLAGRSRTEVRSVLSSSARHSLTVVRHGESKRIMVGVEPTGGKRTG